MLKYLIKYEIISMVQWYTENIFNMIKYYIPNILYYKQVPMLNSQKKKKIIIK